MWSSTASTRYRARRTRCASTSRARCERRPCSGVPGHWQELGPEHLVVVAAAPDHDLGQLAERLLDILPARERGRGGELAGGHGHAQDHQLRGKRRQPIAYSAAFDRLPTT